MEDAIDIDLDGDFSLTAARIAWRLGTRIGTELAKLVDEAESSVTRPSGVGGTIDYNHPPAFFDYNRF